MNDKYIINRMGGQVHILERQDDGSYRACANVSFYEKPDKKDEKPLPDFLFAMTAKMNEDAE